MSNSIKHVYAVNRLSKLILENKIDDDYTADVGVFILENKEDLYFLAFQHKKNAQKVVMKFLKRNIGPFNGYIISKKLSEIGIPSEEKICTLSYSLMILLYWLPILSF